MPFLFINNFTQLQCRESQQNWKHRGNTLRVDKINLIIIACIKNVMCLKGSGSNLKSQNLTFNKYNGNWYVEVNTM